MKYIEFNISIAQMTSYEPLAYFHLIKFGNLHTFVTILIFLLGFRHSVSLITGFSINRSLKKSFLKVHKTFKVVETN